MVEKLTTSTVASSPAGDLAVKVPPFISFSVGVLPD
jgi:hypothetical protein